MEEKIMTIQFRIQEGEYFWGGSTFVGMKMPVSAQDFFEQDLRRSCQNQGMPLFLSNKGRYLWSEEPFKITFDHGHVTAEGADDLALTEAGSCLRDAYLAAMRAHFPFTGKLPPKEFFETAQYNT